MKYVWLMLFAAAIASGANAQTATEQKAIKNLCGCFEVEFKYAETFAADEEYKFPPRYQASGLEWVVAEETSDKKIVMQHLLQVNDTMIVKHWREDWEYEKPYLWKFDHDAAWKKVVNNNPKGQWTQTVWEVDDAPRYQGSSNWAQTNGKYFWQNTADAPLPRREYTKRKDYNVLERTNTVIVTDKSWTHEQDNRKIVRKDDAPDTVIAEEKGYNIYRKTDDSKCKYAAEWWKKHHQFWNTVRASWEESMKNKTYIKLMPSVDGKRLGENLSILENENLSEKQRKEKIVAVINSYWDGSTKSVASNK